MAKSVGDSLFPRALAESARRIGRRSGRCCSCGEFTKPRRRLCRIKNHYLRHDNRCILSHQLWGRSVLVRRLYFTFQALDDVVSGEASIRPNLDKEILTIALPTLALLAVDPVASLVDTAYLGHLGAVELAAVGVGISVFNSVTRLLNMPLLAVTTSAVAAAVGSNAKGEAAPGKGTSVDEAASSALLIACGMGLLEMVALLGVAAFGLGVYGAPDGSLLRTDAFEYVIVRALGAPAFVLLLACQGVFRGLGDGKTPLIASVICTVVNVVLCPILIFGAGLGVQGAALAVVAAEGVATLWLLLQLSQRLSLRLVGGSALQSTAKYLGPTGLLLLRTLGLSCTFALATSIASRTDSAHAASHQICLQLWLASSLLADSLAVAAQSLIARSLAASDSQTATAVVRSTLSWGFSLGLGLSLVLGISSNALARTFTSDAAVLAAISVIFPWVVFTQPINALAFCWDGIVYGVNGFAFAAQAMVLCTVPAISCMLLGQNVMSLDMRMQAVWSGLALLMITRSVTASVPFVRRTKPFRQFEKLMKE